jgi:zinc transporter 1
LPFARIDQTVVFTFFFQVPGIESIHEFHLWQLTGRHVVATVHVKLKELADFVRVAENVKDFLMREGVHSVTVQPEIDKVMVKYRDKRPNPVI